MANTSNGTLSFGEIKQLDAQWWTSPPPNDPAAVWNTWDRDTYYLWGANVLNYAGIALGDSLNGDKMAGPNGPSRGRAHPHYVGVITMSASDLPKNDAVFQSLATLMASGKHVQVPSYGGRLSLGTGIGASVPNWADIQKYLLEQIIVLTSTASSVSIPPGTFWPDVRTTPETPHKISSVPDLQNIVDFLSGNVHAAPAAALAPGDQLHPVPHKVRVASEDYNLVAFYYPNGHTNKTAPCDDHYHAGCFGNFYPCTVTLDYPNTETREKIVPTPQFQSSEAAFHALKWWDDDTIRKQFEACKTGNEALDLSRGLPSPDMTYAGLGRLGAMETVLRQKYGTDNAAFRAALRSTGDAYLIEHATGSNDTYWSDGGRADGGSGEDVTGTNHLGRTLMTIRGEIPAEGANPAGQPAPALTDTDAMVPDFKAAVEFWTTTMGAGA
jgi:predicted NAD-dependent protein-ADP-ribosyltransferase YbiA (DUF1768 family)